MFNFFARKEKKSSKNYQDKIDELNRLARDMTADQIIKLSSKEFDQRLAFASSLSEEDQVITDLISRITSDIEVFTLDTGRLFQETLELLDKNQKRYSMTFKVYYPDNEAVEDMVRNHGINLFYESVANRKLCCGIRKIEPLKRALKNADAWICGLRRSQSETCGDLKVFEWDETSSKIKISPLAGWELKEVRSYIKEHKIDVNPLCGKGFLSIGCACCTRAAKEGGDIRSGRWWWEDEGKKKCEIHIVPIERNTDNEAGA